MNRRTLLLVVLAILILVSVFTLSATLAKQQSSANPLTGNWAAASPSSDGYVRKAYFNLQQDGEKITGTIRSTQFFYKIT
jgi:hypothetical protein